MELTKEKSGGVLNVRVSGRIDINTAVDFGTQITDSLDDINELIIDFKEVEYISSMGLRVILEIQRKMAEKGKMKLINVAQSVYDVFNMTGFTKILTIE